MSRGQLRHVHVLSILHGTRIPTVRAPVPRATGATHRHCRAPAGIVDSKLNERISEVREALTGTAGQQRKSGVTDNFDGSVRARTDNDWGWQTAADVDVLE